MGDMVKAMGELAGGGDEGSESVFLFASGTRGSGTEGAAAGVAGFESVVSSRH